MAPDPYVVASALFSAAGAALAVTRRPSLGVRSGPTPATAPPWAPRRWWVRLAGRRRSSLPFGIRVGLGVASALVTVSVLLGSVGWVAWPVAAAVGIAVPAFLLRLESGRVKKERRDLVLQTPLALDLLAATLTAGLPLRPATAAVVRACPGTVGDLLGGVLKQIELGVSDVDAWRSLIRHPRWGAVAADLARSVESGTMLATTLAVHADEARAERTAAVEIAARQVGVRSVLPLMLCFIPAFLLLGIVPTVVSAVSSALSW